MLRVTEWHRKLVRFLLLLAWIPLQMQGGIVVCHGSDGHIDIQSVLHGTCADEEPGSTVEQPAATRGVRDVVGAACYDFRLAAHTLHGGTGKWVRVASPVRTFACFALLPGRAAVSACGARSGRVTSPAHLPFLQTVVLRL